MKGGFGSYSNWPYPSNLSAFAVPFSVNRPTSGDVSAPFLDSADAMPPNPIHCPVHSRSYDFFSDPIRELDSSTPSSTPYYSGLQVLESSGAPQFPRLGFASEDAYSRDQRLNATEPSLGEAQPYFPSYISSAIHDRTSSMAPNHWSSTSGFVNEPSLGDYAEYAENSPELGFAGQGTVSGNQFTEFNHGKGKQVGVGSSFSSNQTNVPGLAVEERMNQGYQDIKDSCHGEVPRMIDWEKHSMPASADQLDDKSCWWRPIKPWPVEFSGISVMQSSSLSLETHCEDSLKLVVDSGNHHVSYTGVYDKHSRHHDKPSGVDTVSSTPITESVTDLNIGNIVADGDLGRNNFYNIKEAYPMPSPGTSGCFNLGHLRVHLERNEPSSSNNAMISDRNVSRDVVDDIFKARHGFQNPHLSLDSLSLRLNAIEDFNSVECGDRCNPAVDSPCWKGAPTVPFSHCESSEALRPERMHKNEECFGSIIQEPQNFLLDRESNVKMSCDKLNSCQMQIGIVDWETSSAGSPRKFSETKFASEDCKSDGITNAGPFQSELSYDYGLQYLDDITEMKENSLPPIKPIDCEPISSQNEHQVIEENKLVSQKLHTSCISGADAGCNENKCLESGTSHTAEHALSSPSSVANAPTTPEKSAGKVTEKLNVQMLVDMMQNLSELLLNHCSNDACELKEQDCNILRNVISNLNTCVLKNAEQITPAQECLFHQSETSRCAGESCELQQSVHFKRPQSTKIGPESSKVELENPLVQEANLHFGYGTPHWKVPDSIPLRGDEEMTKAENMTKALKKILSENFHDDEATESQTVLYKNLWLEAEAALCSINYKARYNQMKIEMEKHSYEQRDMEEQAKSEIIPSLSKSQGCAPEAHNHPKSDSSAQDLLVLHATNLQELSQLKFSTDMNKPNPLTPEEEGSQDRDSLDSSIQNYTVSGTNKEAAGNDEASVMARYHVLKARVDKSCINTIDLEEPSNIADKLAPREMDNQNQVNFCQDSPIPDIADKLAPREIYNQNQVNFCQDSPIPGKSRADYEPSVLARFHILKFRFEDPSSLSSEEIENLLDEVRFSGKGIEDTIITKDASEGTAVDKSIPKEFHLDLEDNQEIQRRAYEFQVPNYHSDGLASDWEHV